MGNGIINRYKSNLKNSNTVTRTSKICIPYDKWIQGDNKKWGHYKEFNLCYLNDYFDESKSLIQSSSSSQISNSLITQSSTALFQQQQKIDSTISQTQINLLNINASSQASSNESIIYYVNGQFFKPLERLGDSQFIITQLCQPDIIVTIPSNIERYRNDTTSKEMSIKLNRIIGVCDQYIIFQIWKGNGEVEIFIYDYYSQLDDNNGINNFNNYNNTRPQKSSHRIVRKLNRRFNSRTYTCLISPDKKYLLITPDYEDNHSYSLQSHSEVTIIININTFKVIRITSARCDQRFAFDPRFIHNNIRLAEFDTVRGQITDLLNEKVIVCSNHTLKTKVYRVEYTKDGYLIIVICTLPIFQRCKRNYFIYVLNSSTLLHMRSIIDYRGPLLSTYTFTNEFYLLFNMYPSLSNCATNIAILKNIEPCNSLRFIELYSLPIACCISLKEICRKVILRLVDTKNVSKLPLPEKLISYLAFNVR